LELAMSGGNCYCRNDYYIFSVVDLMIRMWPPDLYVDSLELNLRNTGIFR